MSTYNKPYGAIRDTEWDSNPAAPAHETGPIQKGDIVLLERDFDPENPSSYIPARYRQAMLYTGRLILEKHVIN